MHFFPPSQLPEVPAPPSPPEESPRSWPLRKRLLVFAVSLLVGITVGALGKHFGGSDAWFLAVPLCLLVGWIVVANPSACLPTAARNRGDGPVFW